MSDDAQQEIAPDVILAEGIRLAIKEFPQKFRELNEGGQLRKLLQTSKTLTSTHTEQAPERFTEQYLIEPILRGLGYSDPTSDEFASNEPHFVSQPKRLDINDKREPDYQLKNPPSANESLAITCIIEVKAANREQPTGSKQDATEDIREYLDEDTFCKFLRNNNKRYLAGIGTDGLRWTLWMKDLETGEVKQDHPRVDISSVIENEAKRLDTIEGEVTVDRASDRKFLTDEFVPAFAATNLSGHIIDFFADPQ